jgi:hypothetical protein
LTRALPTAAPLLPRPSSPPTPAGHTTSWTLFNIATTPRVQDRIEEELDGLGLLHKPGQPAPRELELDDLKRMPYIAAAAKEAMRMYPVVSIMGRRAPRVSRLGFAPGVAACGAGFMRSGGSRAACRQLFAGVLRPLGP